MKKYMDIPYKQIGDLTLYIDLYMPENGLNPPLIMWIHGGVQHGCTVTESPQSCCGR